MAVLGQKVIEYEQHNNNQNHFHKRFDGLRGYQIIHLEIGFKNGMQNLAKEKTFKSLLAKKAFFIGEWRP